MCTALKFLCRLIEQFCRGDVAVEPTREAPAQTELRPTCAGVFRIILILCAETAGSGMGSADFAAFGMIDVPFPGKKA